MQSELDEHRRKAERLSNEKQQLKIYNQQLETKVLLDIYLLIQIIY